MSAINNISIYIPHVFANIDKGRISDAFESQGIGKVKNVDLVGKLGKEGYSYNAVYVHFEYWYNSSVANNFQERVLNPNKEARLVYEDPWYWIVLENKAKKHASGSRKVRLVLDIPQEEVVTPVKQRSNKDFADMCRAPIKNKLVKKDTLTNSDKEFDLNFKELRRQLQFDTEEDIMDEIENLIDETEASLYETETNLATFDRRYVQELEKENQYYRTLVPNSYSDTLGKIQHHHGVVCSELLYY
jgi:hypothetical protein